MRVSRSNQRPRINRGTGREGFGRRVMVQRDGGLAEEGSAAKLGERKGEKGDEKGFLWRKGWMEEEVSKSKARKGNSWISFGISGRTKGGEDFFFGIGNDRKRSAIIAENLIWFADRSASIRGRRAW